MPLVQRMITAHGYRLQSCEFVPNQLPSHLLNHAFNQRGSCSPFMATCTAEHKSYSKKRNNLRIKKSQAQVVYSGSSLAEAEDPEEYIYSLQVSRIDKGSVSLSL